MYVLSGTKKWALYEPEQSPYLYEGFCKEGKMKLGLDIDTRVDEASDNRKSALTVLIFFVFALIFPGKRSC